MRACVHAHIHTHARTHALCGGQVQAAGSEVIYLPSRPTAPSCFPEPKGARRTLLGRQAPSSRHAQDIAMSLLVVCRPDLPGRCYVHSRGAQLPSQVPFTGVTANSCACRGMGGFPGVRAAHGHSQHSPSPTLRPWHRARFPMSYMMSLGFNTQTKVMSRSHRSKRLQAGHASRSRCQTAGSGGV